jgi:hypothetical protein
MQRSLNAGVYRYELACRFAWGHGGVAAGYMTSVIASRDGTHVMVIAANGHNQQVEGAIFATAERLIATRGSPDHDGAGVHVDVRAGDSSALSCLFMKRTTCRGYETGTSTRARAGTREYWRPTQEG